VISPDFLKDSSEKSLRCGRHPWKSRSFACKASRSDLKVAYARLGSIPAGRLQLFKMARYPSGKGEVCKTFMRRFDSDPRLHPFSGFLVDSVV
jgi:hypothetical protein